jgi:hypothetical protein
VVLTRIQSSRWIAIVVAGVGFAGVLGWQRRDLVSLRHRLERCQVEISRAAKQERQPARAHLDNRAAATPGDGDPAVAAARSELDALRRRMEAERNRKSVGPSTARFAVGQTIAAAEWRNTGWATPEAALETSLWAAAGGDIDTFAGSLTFIDDSSRHAAQALLDALPAGERERYRTPERLIAAMTIPDVPVGSAEVREWTDHHPFGDVDQVAVTVLLSSVDGKLKDTMLNFFQRPDGWKLVLDRRVVAKYARSLQAAPSN